MILGIVIGVSVVYIGFLIFNIIRISKRIAEFEKEEMEKQYAIRSSDKRSINCFNDVRFDYHQHTYLENVEMEKQG